MRRPLLAALLVGLAAPACAAALPRQVVTVSLTTRRPNTATGATVEARYLPDAAAGGHPHTLRHVADGFPAGTAIRTGSVPRCTTPDLVLTLAGPAACPAASRVGSGTVIVDLGLGGSYGQVPTALTLINAGGGQILFLGREPRTGIGLVDHATVHGSTIDIDTPVLPGLSAEGAWVDRETFTIPAASGLLVSPASCPAGRRWFFQRRHDYGDGMSQTVSVPLPCRRPRRHR